MQWGPTPLVHEGETICTICDHVSTEERVVEAPITGIPVGVLEILVALPGHPLCHLPRIDSETHEEIEREIANGEFAGYRMLGVRWMGDGEEAE